MADRLKELRDYAASPDATAEGVCERLNRLDAAEWEGVLRDTFDLVPLPGDGRSGLMLGDGGDGWSVLWWDASGRRVIGRLDHQNHEWVASVDA